MELTQMRFRDFVWPHNPQIYEMSFRSRVSEHGYPGGDYALQYMGRGCRVFRGEGEFVGESAYEDFTRLANTFYDSRPGILIHPLWQPTAAYLVSLSCRETPMKNHVRYAFEFWECPDAALSDDTDAGSARLTASYRSQAEVGA